MIKNGYITKTFAFLPYSGRNDSIFRFVLVTNSCPPLSITNHNPTLAQAGECQDNLVDILFILDESGSVGTADFQKTLTFVHNVVDRLEIGPYDVQVAVLTFDSVVRMRFHFNRFSTKQVSVDNVIT